MAPLMPSPVHRPSGILLAQDAWPFFHEFFPRNYDAPSIYCTVYSGVILKTNIVLYVYIYICKIY